MTQRAVTVKSVLRTDLNPKHIIEIGHYVEAATESRVGDQVGSIMLDTPMRRCCVHEAGHAVAAWRFLLPLERVSIGDDGSGHTSYTRRFSWGEVEHWIVSVYAGPEAETLEFGNAPEISDLRNLRNMETDLDLDLSTSRLAALRSIARSLVARERRTIRTLADELLRRREMSGDEISILLG